MFDNKFQMISINRRRDEYRNKRRKDNRNNSIRNLIIKYFITNINVAPNVRRNLEVNNTIISQKGKNAVNTFSEIVINDISKLEEGNGKCVICLEDFHNKEKVTALPCIHLFHQKCIRKWIEKRKTCPICKFELTEENVNKKIKENLGNYS